MLANLKNIRIIDFHTHTFPDDVASRAIEALFTAYHFTPATDGTLSAQLKMMEETGVSYSVIQPVATKPAQVTGINNWAASHTDPRIISFAGMHPDYEDIAGEIDRIISLGIPGIKIQGNWQNVFVDDRSMYPIYEAAQGRLMIMFHAGAEIAPLDELKATPKRIYNVHKDFPNLTMIAAHMGGYLMWDESEEFLVGENIYLDTSASFREKLPDERFLKMIRRHGTERILFATDMPLISPKAEIERLCSIGLTDDDLEMILSKNAMRLLGDRVT